jgi:hypothetical protein
MAVSGGAERTVDGALAYTLFSRIHGDSGMVGDTADGAVKRG